jgi:phosphomannomutase
LARYEGNFRAGAEDPLSLNELLALLASTEESEGRARSIAIACALSASEGWEEAVKHLGGAFAEESPGLKERKDRLPED